MSTQPRTAWGHWKQLVASLEHGDSIVVASQRIAECVRSAAYRCGFIMKQKRMKRGCTKKRLTFFYLDAEQEKKRETKAAT